jgi:taurine--2-oxoglutarate transaminase
MGMYAFIRWNYLFIAPPLCINEEQMLEGLAMISKALEISDAECY